MLHAATTRHACADTGASSSSTTALNPAANAPVSAKAAKGSSTKSSKKSAKTEPTPSPPSTSLQDVAIELVQQVCLHA